MYIADIVLVGLIFTYIIYVDIKKYLIYTMSTYFIYIFFYIQNETRKEKRKSTLLGIKILINYMRYFQKAKLQETRSDAIA